MTVLRIAALAAAGWFLLSLGVTALLAHLGARARRPHGKHRR
ncbi:hypothetical protein [Streptomyces sp. NPDC086023]